MPRLVQKGHNSKIYNIKSVIAIFLAKRPGKRKSKAVRAMPLMSTTVGQTGFAQVITRAKDQELIAKSLSEASLVDIVSAWLERTLGLEVRTYEKAAVLQKFVELIVISCAPVVLNNN